MKRTIEYCDELVNDKSRTYYEIVKQIQIDAIDETVKRCAQQALLSIDGIVEKSNGQTYLCDEGNHYTETWINIDKQSILQVAEELISKL